MSAKIKKEQLQLYKTQISELLNSQTNYKIKFPEEIHKSQRKKLQEFAQQNGLKSKVYQSNGNLCSANK